jgi:hypothetical protein
MHATATGKDRTLLSLVKSPPPGRNRSPPWPISLLNDINGQSLNRISLNRFVNRPQQFR